MKIVELKDEPDTRFCVRCGILESEVKEKGSGGCSMLWGSSHKRHSYTTERELDNLPDLIRRVKK